MYYKKIKRKVELKMKYQEGYPLYLRTEDRIIEVVGELPTMDVITANGINTIDSLEVSLVPYKGYIIDGYVYMYTNEIKSESNYAVPWVEIVEGVSGYQQTTRSLADEDMEEFSIERLTPMDVTSISDSLVEGEKLYNEEAINDMNMAASVFVPVINETDDFLKKIVKQTIISKNIDINRLKSCMSKNYGLSNMKQALSGKTRMSTTNFILWAELLGIDFTVTVRDNGHDTINPLKLSLLYDSYTDSIIEEK